VCSIFVQRCFETFSLAQILIQLMSISVEVLLETPVDIIWKFRYSSAILTKIGLYRQVLVKYRATINDSFVFKTLYFPKYYTYKYDWYIKITVNSPSLYCVHQLAARVQCLYKMATKQEKRFCVFEYARCSSVIAAQRAFKREYGKEPPCKQNKEYEDNLVSVRFILYINHIYTCNTLENISF
jgi:hypothetical protein